MLGDVNGDGRSDIVGFGSGGAYVSLGQSDGTFATAILGLNDFGAGASAGGWTSQDTFPRMLGDVNGDGLDDIVAFGSNWVSVAVSLGDGTFAPRELIYEGFATNVGGWSSQNQYPRMLGDVNGDGRAEIIGFGNSGVRVSLSEGIGADTLNGGTGDDLIYAAEGSDTIDGGEGIDTVNYTGAASGGVLVDLATGEARESDLSVDTLTGIENVAGSAGDDTLTGDANANTLDGSAGDDTLDGGAGNDILIGSAGNDTYKFGLGGGQDAIANGDADPNSTDILSFGSNIASDELWFSRSNDDLVISLLGTTDRVTVGNWYGDDASKIDEFVDGDGELLNRSEIDQLVSAMAGFSPSDGTGSGGVEPGTVPQEVQLAIDSAWQPPSA